MKSQVNELKITKNVKTFPFAFSVKVIEVCCLDQSYRKLKISIFWWNYKIRLVREGSLVNIKWVNFLKTCFGNVLLVLKNNKQRSRSINIFNFTRNRIRFICQSIPDYNSLSRNTFSFSFSKRNIIVFLSYRTIHELSREKLIS